MDFKFTRFYEVFLIFTISAHKLVKKNANIDWENQTCDDIDQQFRAISEVVSMMAQIGLDIITLKENIDWENQTCDDIDQQFRAISEVVSMVAQMGLDINP